MSKSVVLGIKGEAGLWLVDLEKGTAIRIEDSTSGAIGAVFELRKKGSTVTNGVDVAVTISPTADIASGVFE